MQAPPTPRDTPPPVGVRFGRAQLAVVRATELCAGPLCAIVAAVPEERRWEAIRRLARAIEPLVRLRLRFSIRIDGYREEALHFLTDRATRRGLLFRPEITVRGEEVLQPGTFLLTGHFHLNRLLFRRLHDRGHRLCLLAADNVPHHYLGTRAPVEHVAKDTHVLQRIRRRLNEGAIAGAALDVADPRPGFRRIDTCVGPRYAGNTAAEFGLKLGFPLRFCASRVAADGSVLTEVLAPAGATAEEVMSDYAAMLARHAASIRR